MLMTSGPVVVQLKLVRGFEFAIVRRKPISLFWGGGARQWGLERWCSRDLLDKR